MAAYIFWGAYLIVAAVVFFKVSVWMIKTHDSYNEADEIMDATLGMALGIIAGLFWPFVVVMHWLRKAAKA